LAIHDADVHLARVQIDSAIVLGSGGVILHGVYSVVSSGHRLILRG
jgi:hypothetical protein